MLAAGQYYQQGTTYTALFKMFLVSYGKPPNNTLLLHASSTLCPSCLLPSFIASKVLLIVDYFPPPTLSFHRRRFTFERETQGNLRVSQALLVLALTLSILGYDSVLPSFSTTYTPIFLSWPSSISCDQCFDEVGQNDHIVKVMEEAQQMSIPSYASHCSCRDLSVVAFAMVKSNINIYQGDNVSFLVGFHHIEAVLELERDLTLETHDAKASGLRVEMDLLLVKSVTACYPTAFDKPVIERFRLLILMCGCQRIAGVRGIKYSSSDISKVSSSNS
ncbi:hypothetical protein Tco_0065351 [Tanacetum coccineum]